MPNRRSICGWRGILWIIRACTGIGIPARATLFYEGTAALALEDIDEALSVACRSIWDDIGQTKLHINGSVGAHRNEEKFGTQYELPNNAYLETCAGVGFVFFGMEMYKLTGDAAVWDAVESTLYNLIPTSVSADGTKYTYENPLESDGNYNRWDWHRCPCCPPMLLKLVGTLPSMIFAENGYAVVLRIFRDGDVVELVYNTPIVKYIAHPYVKADHGKVTVKYGPTLYCAESADNPGADTFEAFDFELDEDTPLTMDAEGNILAACTGGVPCKLVPYYKWNNRGAGFMRAWLNQAGYTADVMNTDGWEGKLYRPYAEYSV